MDNNYFDIVEYVADALKEISDMGIVVKEGWYDESIEKTHITYFCLTEKSEEYSDDEEETNTFYIQLDVWTRDTLEGNKIKNLIRKLLKKAEFKLEDCKDQYETDSTKRKLYHKALRFNYTEDLGN